MKVKKYISPKSTPRPFFESLGLIYVYTLWFDSIVLHPVPVIHLQRLNFTLKCVTRKAVEEGGGARQKGRRRSLLSLCGGDDDFLAWESERGPREHVSMAMQPRLCNLSFIFTVFFHLFFKIEGRAVVLQPPQSFLGSSLNAVVAFNLEVTHAAALRVENYRRV